MPSKSIRVAENGKLFICYGRMVFHCVYRTFSIHSSDVVITILWLSILKAFPYILEMHIEIFTEERSWICFFFFMWKEEDRDGGTDKPDGQELTMLGAGLR